MHILIYTRPTTILWNLVLNIVTVRMYVALIWLWTTSWHYDSHNIIGYIRFVSVSEYLWLGVLANLQNSYFIAKRQNVEYLPNI